MKIFLDDQANTDRVSWVPEGFDVATTSMEFTKMIEDAISRGDRIEAISFDNDLGEEIEGRHLLKWLMENYPELMSSNPELTVHSANTIGKDWMLCAIEHWKKNWQELVSAKDRPHPWGKMR